MATIKEVAKRTGMSPTTVSRVINNHPYVDDKKRRIVLEAMDELGYVPNSSARRLRGQKTNTIAVIISRIVNPFFSHLVDAMELIAGEKGYQLILCDSRLDKERELRHLELLKAKQVDGVILASLQNDWETIKPFTKYGPIVMCNEYDRRAELPMIRCNQYEGGYIGTKHLIEKGHTNIAYAGGANRIELTYDRWKGFMKAMDEHGLTIPDEWMFPSFYGIEDGKNIFHRIYAMQNGPTAIFAGGDEVAAGIIQEAKRFHCRVPDDLAVVGYDDQPLASLIDPGITTINQPTKLMGTRAMEIMVDMIKNQRKVTFKEEILPLELVIRQST
ncbi:LacI family DNA-binding transcriptional regulator [Salisediminibacterium selenitireducens]|uniref:Transcriptional regulator, LacI family n=1 Tax=Bacillus selenitireducens (strain ATCC 700615 / DSM 15326 / MLS10) TaxID=439292 RepID=D6XT34_BACIE|nr:LacI family DNA-binding transcriptional regulator [Salisediminibacterium selenitireducens]ADH98970.1 transcriptional regulator, LacI family [[Bacillus] selenitireducens MLS10]